MSTKNKKKLTFQMPDYSGIPAPLQGMPLAQMIYHQDHQDS
jgi:hypothetical protein